MGNNLEFGVFVLSSGLPHIRSGKVIALGTTEARRSAAAPDIPALAESPQYKNVDIGVWFALMAPAHLPKPVYNKLMKKDLEHPIEKGKLKIVGAEYNLKSGKVEVL
jgi:tripartite-type tricarboxylate transporter receptor subunit TctC